MINCETFELTGSDNVKFLVDRFSTSSEAKKIIIFCHGFKGFKDWGGFNYVADFIIFWIPVESLNSKLILRDQDCGITITSPFNLEWDFSTSNFFTAFFRYFTKFI